MTFKEWYSEENIAKLEEWVSKGLTEAEIAHNIGIARQSFWDWKRKHTDLLDILKKGKQVADQIVENALFKRANGYSVDEEQITYGINENGEQVVLQKKTVKKYIPPDTTAQIFWLKNRKPDIWKDKRDVDVGANENIETIQIKVDTVNEKDIDRLKALQENLFKDGT